MRSLPSSRPRPFTAFALAALISLAGAGCGSDADPGSGGSADSGGGGGGGQQSADRDRAVKFAACMRENDVSDFPDPDAAGEFEYGITVSGEVWTKALNACKELQPPGSFSANRSEDQQAAGLRFAECIRENGVKDFPDPVNGEPLVDTNKIPSTDRKGGMTVLNAAMRTCADIGAEAMGRKP